MASAAAAGFKGRSSCADMGPDTIGGIYFGGDLACETEKWSEVTLVIFNNTEGLATDYAACMDGWRYFAWPLRPMHAPWKEWVSHRVITATQMQLYPQTECEWDRPNGVYCDSKYYEAICDRSGGLALGIILILVVVVLLVTAAASGVSWRQRVG